MTGRVAPSSPAAPPPFRTAAFRTAAFRTDALLAGGLLLAVVLVYWGVWTFGFHDLDDPAYVSANPALRLGLGRDFLAWAFWNSLATAPHYIPLTWLAIGVQHALFGDWAGGYHLVNLLLHLGNTALLFSLVRRLGGAPGMALLAAGFFGLHPLRVESVVWITEIKDVLSTAFWLGCLHAHVSWARHGSSRGGRRARWLSSLLLLLGALTKPMLVTAPVTLLCLDFWPLGRTRWWRGPLPETSWGRLLLEKWPHLLVAGVLGLWTVWTAAHGAMSDTAVLSLLYRVQVAVTGVAFYLWKTVWPVGLSPFYPLPPRIPPLHVAGSLVVLLGVSLLAWRWRRRQPGLAMAWAWYLATVAPVSGLLQAGTQFAADRFTYVPLLGLAIWLGFAAGGEPEHPSLDRRRWRPCPLSLAALAGLALLGLLSSRQVGHWRDPERLWRHALAVSPANHMALNHLGGIHLARGEMEAALANLRRAVEVAPHILENHVSLSRALVEAGQLDASRATLERAIAWAPETPMLRRELAVTQALQGDLDAAAATVSGLATAPASQAALWLELGQQAWRRKRPELALELAGRALALHRDAAEAHNLSGAALVALGRPAEAVAAFEEATRLAPDNPVLRRNLDAARRAAGLP